MFAYEDLDLRRIVLYKSTCNRRFGLITRLNANRIDNIKTRKWWQDNYGTDVWRLCQWKPHTRCGALQRFRAACRRPASSCVAGTPAACTGRRASRPLWSRLPSWVGAGGPSRLPLASSPRGQAASVSHTMTKVSGTKNHDLSQIQWRKLWLYKFNIQKYKTSN